MLCRFIPHSFDFVKTVWDQCFECGCKDNTSEEAEVPFADNSYPIDTMTDLWQQLPNSSW